MSETAKKKRYIPEGKVYVNISRRIPVCFVIDTSSSMATVIDGDFEETEQQIFQDGESVIVVRPKPGGRPIVSVMDKVNEGIKSFYAAMNENITTKNSCDVAFVTFSDSCKFFTEPKFCPIDSNRIPTFKINGNNTYLSRAVGMAIDELLAQEQYYKSNSISSYRPWLVILTDGQPTDDVTLIQSRLMDLQRKNKLTVYTMAPSDDKKLIDSLKGFSVNDPLDCSTPEKIIERFQFIATSVSAAMGGVPF